ncbi:MAG: hypothetical protein ACTSO7_00335 [Candidatus Heimdallarchaeota archaeon]
MCHLAGYIGNKNGIPYIIESLRIQEPLIGAQATGLAAIANNEIVMDKEIGPVKYFEEQIDFKPFTSTIAMGHTRYSLKNLTYAETNTKEKAHPFWNSTKKFVTMHNGTIINCMDFVTPLEEMGYVFKSKSIFHDKILNQEKTDYCDSEFFSFILEEELKKTADLKQAIKNSCKDIQGHFAFVTLHPENLDEIIIANWMQPMYVAFNNEEAFFSSFEVGLQPVQDVMNWSFKPSYNSLITLSRGKITIEPLIDERKIPANIPNEDLFEQVVFEIIKSGKKNPVEIYLELNAHPEKINMSKTEFENLCPKSGFTFTPMLFHAVKNLAEKGKIIRKLEYVNEGGIKETPRYMYYMK